MQQQPNPNKFQEDLRASNNILLLLANAHATTITMFTRHSFGTNVPGLTGVVSLLILLLTTAAQEDVVMLWFTGAWIVALIFQRIRTAHLVSLGWREHSYYSGWPWFAMLFGIKDEHAAKGCEACLCFFIGLLLMPFSPALGGFVMFGFVSLLFVLLTRMAGNRRQVTAMRDLQFEQRAMADRMRGRRNDF